MELIVIGIIILIVVLVVFPILGFIFSNPVGFAVGLIIVGLLWCVLKLFYKVSNPYLTIALIRVVDGLSWFDNKIDNILSNWFGLKDTQDDQQKSELLREVSKSDVKFWFYMIIVVGIIATVAESINL